MPSPLQVVTLADEHDGIIDKNAIAIGRNEMETVAKLVQAARAALVPLTDAKTFNQISVAVAELGDVDGTGVFLRLAALDSDHSGSLSEAEYARFLTESELMINNLQSSTNNASVVTALLLTIAIDLFFVEMSPPFSSADEGFSAFESVASGYFSGGDLKSADSLAKGLYVVEVIFNTIMMASCAFGLLLSLFLHQLVSSMPGRVPALHFILAHAKLYTWLATTWWLGMFSLMFAVSFAAARYSLVAFFAGLSASTCVLLGLKFVMLTPGKWQYRYFHAQAKHLLSHGKEQAPAVAKVTRVHPFLPHG